MFNKYKTEILKYSDESIDKVVKSLKNGEIAAFPTETVYGLGALIDKPKAIDNIFEAKERPQDNPLIVHISDLEWFYKLSKEKTRTAQILTDAFWPGPLTVIVPKSNIVSDKITANLKDVAIRFPSNKIAQNIIKAAQTPICAPSANKSGTPSPTTAQDVYNDLNGKIPYILDGGACEVGIESTVVKINENGVTVLRPGHITVEQLKEVCGEVNINKGVLNQPDKKEKAQSPGMKFKHYAPNAQITLVKGHGDKFVDYINENIECGDYVIILKETPKQYKIQTDNIICLGADEYSQEKNLFTVLRKLDELSVKKAYVQAPKTDGIGLALYNRLIRAAGFDVVDLSGE